MAERSLDGFVLRVDRPGELGSCQLVGTLRHAPRAGEVEVRVEAASLNFYDVLFALGMAEEFGWDGMHALGLDCAGIVTLVGKETGRFRPGDRVAVFSPGCLASHVTVSADLVTHIPAGLSAVEAATLPVAYLTAWYGLVRLARLGAGESVLVHSATGGVGLAALNVARLRGARVLATVGSLAKRQYLETLDVHDVMSSRSVEFADQTRAITGDGVDVVLNSLTGEALQAGLELLRWHGRFIEIGKRDIYTDTKIGLYPFRRCISMHSVDLLQLAKMNRGLVRELLAELAPLFVAGDLRPLPHTVHPITEATAALRAMTTRRHIGKIVVTLPE